MTEPQGWQPMEVAKVADAMRNADNISTGEGGVFPRLFDLLDFSGENQARLLVNGLAQAAIAAMQSGWQAIESAPPNETIDVWMQEIEGDGWRYADLEVVGRNPWMFMNTDSLFYHPHENGYYATHWMYPPKPPQRGGVGG